MDAVAGAGRLESLNGVDDLGGLVTGGCTAVDLSSRELGRRELAVGVSRLLPRSSATVTVLNLRYALNLRWSVPPFALHFESPPSLANNLAPPVHTSTDPKH
jgi:hypothetical protein